MYKYPVYILYSLGILHLLLLYFQEHRHRSHVRANNYYRYKKNRHTLHKEKISRREEIC